MNTAAPIGRNICPSCQKPMVDSVIADLGHRNECVPCRAIALRLGDLSNLTLSPKDLPETPWSQANQSLMLCPNCPAEKLQEVVYSPKFPEPLYFCQRCKGIVLSHESLGRIRRFRLKLEVKGDTAVDAWLDPHSGFVSLLAFPAAIIAAWLCEMVPAIGMLLQGLNTQFHEFGHAFFSLMRGVPAIPAIVVTMPLPLLPRPAVFGLAALGAFFWANKGRQEGLKAFSIFFYGIIALQVYLTFIASNGTSEGMVILGGTLGEFLIPLFLGLTFFYDVPKFWNWNVFRYVALFLAVYCLEHNAHFWSDIVKGKAAMPFGSLVAGAGDTNGDMNRLVAEFGWTEFMLSRFFNFVGLFSRITLWGHFGYLLVQRMKKSD